MVYRMFELGFLVKSKVGRDKGRIYVIINRSNDSYVRLIDGDKRKFYNPKLKNIKHLEPLNHRLDKIALKLDENKKIFDSEIYSAIKGYKENFENG